MEFRDIGRGFEGAFLYHLGILLEFGEPPISAADDALRRDWKPGLSAAYVDDNEPRLERNLGPSL